MGGCEGGHVGGCEGGHVGGCDGGVQDVRVGCRIRWACGRM